MPVRTFSDRQEAIEYYLPFYQSYYKDQDSLMRDLNASITMRVSEGIISISG